MEFQLDSVTSTPSAPFSPARRLVGVTSKRFWTLGCSSEPASLTTTTGPSSLNIVTNTDSNDTYQIADQIFSISQSTPKKSKRSSLSGSETSPNGSKIYQGFGQSCSGGNRSGGCGAGTESSGNRTIPCAGTPSGTQLAHHLHHMRNFPRDWKLSHTDSGQSSLEYWDYSVELEMLKGPEDLQLAAELGKTLLERNRELEGTIRHQQTVIDDHVQEIEYLSKQTAALREVNDSRLRIYEQLEVSIQDMEKTNQQLTADTAHDRKKIRGLTNAVEALETRNEELQRSLEEARRAAAEEREGAERSRGRRGVLEEERQGRRSLSCEHSGQEAVPGDPHAGVVPQLTARLQQLQGQLRVEGQRREELETDLTHLAQEHEAALTQLSALRERMSAPAASLQEELAVLDGPGATGAERLCKKCLGSVGDTGSSPTIYDLSESIEDGGDVSLASDRALVRLPNGAMAWGSQESLASMGQVVSQVSSSVTSPAAELAEVPRNSLLSELDTQYRILIEKYEALLDAREQQDRQHRQQQVLLRSQSEPNGGGNLESRSDYISSEAEEMSGPMSLVLPVNESTETLESSLTHKCQRCANCSCGITGSAHQRPKSNMEEFSEVETSSSGFSEGESRLFNRTTQTDCVWISRINKFTPTVEAAITSAQFLDLNSPVNPCDARFQTAPEYKKLFQEIFSVLKKTVNENSENLCECSEMTSAYDLHEADAVRSEETDAVRSEETDAVRSEETDAVRSEETDAVRSEETDAVRSEETDVTYTEDADMMNSEVAEMTHSEVTADALDVNTASATVKSSESYKAKDDDIDMAVQKEATNQDKMVNSMSLSLNGGCKAILVEDMEGDGDHLKPIRPCSLDLPSNDSSRSSSDSRRKRRQHKIRIESIQMKQLQEELNRQKKNRANEMAASKSGKAIQQNTVTHEALLENPQGKEKSRHNSSESLHLCPKHRQQQNRRRSRRNRSRNSSGQRPPKQEPGVPTSTTDALYSEGTAQLATAGTAATADVGHRPPPPPTAAASYSYTAGRHTNMRRECLDRRQGGAAHRTSSPASAYVTPKMSLPSVEVAKLRKLELTYAEVLKSHMRRAANRRQ